MSENMNAENPGLSKYTVSFGLSLVAASVINGLLVVAKEKSPAVMAGMKHLTGHHWTAHGAIVVLLFLVLGWILAMANGGRGLNLGVNSLIKILVGGVVVGGLIIVGFYLFAD
jgi:hypothetical protein